MNCVPIVGEILRLGLLILCECLYVCVCVCACFKRAITFHTNEQKGGIMMSNCITGLAVIASSKLRCDISDGEVLS